MQLGVVIAPMHYYGEKDKYDYANNKFGFDKGDLSHVRSVTTQPMGAGPYKFVKFENGTVNFEANDSYYLGAPKIKHVNFLEFTARPISSTASSPAPLISPILPSAPTPWTLSSSRTATAS